MCSTLHWKIFSAQHSLFTRDTVTNRARLTCWELFQYTDMSYRFQYVFHFKERVTETGYFSCCLKCLKCYCPNKWCSRWMPLLLHFCCPKPVQINCLRSITGSPMLIPRRLLTQQRIFSEVYCYEVATSHKAMKCYFSCLIAQYLQSSLLLNIKLTWNYRPRGIANDNYNRQLRYGKNVTSHGFLSNISNSPSGIRRDMS